MWGKWCVGFKDSGIWGEVGCEEVRFEGGVERYCFLCVCRFDVLS